MTADYDRPASSSASRGRSARPGMRLLLSAVLATGLGLSLAGCKSSEEKAEEYYQSGLELLEKGDADRAIVQFRNVFNIEGTHYEARKKLAEVLQSQGKDLEAYSQYLRLAEQYPDDLPTRIALSLMAFEQNQNDEFTRHVARAVELAPDDPAVKSLELARRYRDTALAEDDAARNQLAEEARKLSETRPDDPMLLSILLDKAGRDKDLDSADTLTARLIALQPDNRRRYRQRMALLAERKDMPGLEQHLKTTLDRFPDDQEAKADYLVFLMSQNRAQDAEAYLRQLADAAPADDQTAKLDLIRFIEIQRGRDAARAELDKTIAAGGDPLLFNVLRAGFDFSDGKQQEAIAEMRKVLEGVTEPTDQSRDVQIQLARMLVTADDLDGARKIVDEVLAANAAHPGALKMQAAWNTAADKTDDAILSLRSVLDQTPDDVEALTLLANAYHRAGEPDLAREFLTKAAQASNNAPEPSLRLAQALFDEGRYRPAEDALLPALRQSPANLELLALLGRTYLAMPDLPRAEGVITRLRELGSQEGNDRASAMAEELDLNRLAQAEGSEAATERLQELTEQADGGLAAKLELIRVRMGEGKLDEAKKLAQELVTEAPDSRPARMALAVTAAASGESDIARTELRKLIEENPKELQPYMTLLRSYSHEGDEQGALQVIDEGLAALPDNPDLLWAKAGLIERQGDVDGALAIYEQLYTRNSNAIIVANNLASLLATYKADDPASVQRASVVVRRLKDTQEPAFMDTYGWIQHLNGASQAALPYLEGAAVGLPDDPVVQIHLGLVQEAVGKTTEAKVQLQKALKLLSGDQNPALAKQAEEALTRLEGGQPAPTAPETQPAN